MNPIQTKALYETAIAYAGLTGTETVIDAYCGIGTIGMTAAAHAKNVIGVELNPSAVRDAIGNAKLNHCKNIRFVCADAGEYMKKLASNDEKTTIDVVFMDPPRSGSTPAFIEALHRLAPKKIVYISCNPDTLGRDLRIFETYGYIAKVCQPFDMFPFTDDVENVTVLERRKERYHDRTGKSKVAVSGNHRDTKKISGQRAAAWCGSKKTSKQKKGN